MELKPIQAQTLEQPEGLLNLRDILTVLFKYKHIVISVSFLITLASLGLALSMKTVYEAETSLLVKIGREHMFKSEADDNTPRMAIDLKTLVAPELAILTSQGLGQQVLETIGVNIMYPELLEDPPEDLSLLQAALPRFQQSLDVSQEEESNIIRVIFQHDNPQMAAKAVNTLAKYWKERHLKVFSTPQAPFLQEQAKTYRATLEQSESQLQQFKHEHGISSFPKQKELLLEQRQELDTTLKTGQNEMQGLTTKIASLTNQLKTIPKEIPLSTVNEQRLMIDDTKRELLTLRRKEQEFSGKYQDANRLLIDLRQEIGLIQTFIDEQEVKLGDTVTSGRNPIYQQLDLELLNAKSQQAALHTQGEVTRRQLQALDNQISHLSQLQHKFDRLAREVVKDQTNLSRYVEKVEAAKITEEMDRQQIANVSVIQAATVPIKPAKSNKTLIVLLGLILGVASGIVLSFVIENLQTSYTRPEQASNDLGLPILVSISDKG